MKKKIIIPIVAALVAVVVAVGAAAVVRNKDNNIWYEAAAVRGHFISTSGDDIPRGNSFDLVYSVAGLKELCAKYENHFVNEESADCKCKMCTRLQKYDETFFADRTLIICEQGVPNIGNYFSVKDIYVENKTLILNMYEVLRLGHDSVSCLTVFVEIKRTDTENIINKKKDIIEISESSLPKMKKMIIPEGEM